jgi:hypothetical protein
MMGTTMSPVSTRKPPISMTARLSANQPIPLHFSAGSSAQKEEQADLLDVSLDEPEQAKDLKKTHALDLVEGLDDELEPVEYPSSDQFAAYNAKHKEQQYLEWGKQFETPARVLGWVDNQLKSKSRRANSSAKSLCSMAMQKVYSAITETKLATASVLKRAAQALESNAESDSALEPDHAKKHKPN